MEKVFRLVAGEGCWIGVVGGWLGKLKFNSSVPAGKVGEWGRRGEGGLAAERDWPSPAPL